MQLFVIVASAVILTATGGMARSACWNDQLDGRSGDLLVTRSGAVYRILDAAATWPFWSSLAPVIICDGVVVNVTGELTTHSEIRNQDENEIVTAALAG